MNLRLRQFDLRATTADGVFGVSLVFEQGLVVLRGDNSSGKSTSLQGILYALGLEGMLSPSRAIPLPHVATSSLTDDVNGQELDVLESHVALEFENAEGRIATVRRFAKHSSINTDLITVWDGPVLTEGVRDLTEHAYFVRRSGAAQREAGFHHWLAEYVGWDLPEVPRYDGGVSPLYLETIFPLFFVEQKRGWAGIQAQTPTYLRIRDVTRRNVEFVLALSGTDIAAERQLLREKMTELRGRWSAVVNTFRDAANEHGLAVRGVPDEPTSDWPLDPGPSLWLASADEWIALDSELSRLNEELTQLTNRVLPRAEDAAPEVSSGLQRHLDELREVGSLADSIRRELAMEEDQIQSLKSRVLALQGDIRRSQDAEILQRMGAPLTAVTLADCPTCHQELPSTLLDPAAAIVAMPLERNISLLKEQIDLFEAMRSDLDAAASAKEQRLVVLDEQTRSLQQSIRSERETLVSAQGSPSLEDVERRVHLRDQVEALGAVRSRLGALSAALAELAQAWTVALQEQSRLRVKSTSDSDQARLSALQTSFLEQLDEYGFTSLPISELSISEDTYFPVYEGFDLGFDLSASDMVRTIWAHRIGILEVGRAFPDNHAQLLVFDEPRQQSTDPLSFQALFRRVSQSAEFGQQVIFATSEPEANVRAMLQGVPHQYLGFTGKMIQRIG